MLMSLGCLVDRMVGICQIVHEFVESEIAAYQGRVLFAGIIEEDEVGDSEYMVRAERDCQILG